MNKKEFIKIAMSFGLTKKEAKTMAKNVKIINQELKEDGYNEPYTYDDLFNDRFGENYYENLMETECQEWLYEQGYYD